MFLRTTSIRGKIAVGYLLSLSLLLLVATLLFVSLLVVEDQVEYTFGISRFFDTALEMRRYEKNYLLYRRKEDLEEAVRYAESAIALARGEGTGRGAGRRRLDPRWLLAGAAGDAAAPDQSAERAVGLLRDYAALLRKVGEGRPREGSREATAAEASIRELGREITGIAEKLSAVEGRNIQEMLRSGRTTLILLVVLFLIGTAVVARVVLLTAIRPLRELEQQMQRIASGDYQELPVGPGGDETAQMKAAFNRMIREVFEHRQEKLQSERLAALGTALAGIAHEINNPLSNISTSAEILKEENERIGPGERREMIDQIISETDRATDIIRAVLDFTRDTRLERRSTNLLSAVRGSLVLVSRQMPAHVTVGVDVAPEVEVLADKTRLEQAFVNLLTNSIDALREGGPESRISVSARGGGEGSVEIVFRDTGAGIPAQLVPKVFDPFFTTKDVGKGTGLGLYLTHQIVEQHGGAIRVESAPGEGTAVFIRLPGGESRRAPPDAGEPARGHG